MTSIKTLAYCAMLIMCLSAVVINYVKNGKKRLPYNFKASLVSFVIHVILLSIIFWM